MKKLIIITAIIILALQATTAQDIAEKKSYPNIFKFSVTNFFDNTFQVSYERKICANSGLMFSAGILYKNNNSDKMEGFKTDVQYKYFVYTKEKENTGMTIYFAPYVFYRYTEKTSYYYSDFPPYNYPWKYYYNSFSGGVLFGMGFTIAKKICIDAYVGGGIKRTFGAHLKDELLYYNNSIWQPGYNGITPRGGIDVGFKF
jgi:hypothetical protein